MSYWQSIKITSLQSGVWMIKQKSHKKIDVHWELHYKINHMRIIMPGGHTAWGTSPPWSGSLGPTSSAGTRPPPTDALLVSNDPLASKSGASEIIECKTSKFKLFFHLSHFILLDSLQNIPFLLWMFPTKGLTHRKHEGEL